MSQPVTHKRIRRRNDARNSLRARLGRLPPGLARFVVRARAIERRNQVVDRRRCFRCLWHHLRAVRFELDLAEAAKPGPDRLLTLGHAGRRLNNTRRCVRLMRIPLHRTIERALKRYEALIRHAGASEAIGTIFDRRIHIIRRDAAGRWSERIETAH